MIDAHSLQKNGPLAHLKDQTNRVYGFRPGTTEFGSGVPTPIGWNEASTFRGLCSKHDQIFAPIETRPFQGTLEQAFLVGYRGLFLEVHEKRAAINAFEMLAKKVPNLTTTRDWRTVRLQQQGRRKGLAEIGAQKRTYDDAWRAHDFAGIAASVIWFEGALSVASAGAVSPDFLVSGDVLQELHRPGMHSLSFGTVARDDGGAIVFTWPRAMNRMARFVESLVNLPRSELPNALLLFMFSYVSNTFFKADWWEGLRPAARVRIGEAAMNTQQYYTPVNYRMGPVVDWTVTKVDFHNA